MIFWRDRKSNNLADHYPEPLLLLDAIRIAINPVVSEPLVSVRKVVGLFVPALPFPQSPRSSLQLNTEEDK